MSRHQAITKRMRQLRATQDRLTAKLMRGDYQAYLDRVVHTIGRISIRLSYLERAHVGHWLRDE